MCESIIVLLLYVVAPKTKINYLPLPQNIEKKKILKELLWEKL